MIITCFICNLVEAVKESEVVINQLTSERNDQTVGPDGYLIWPFLLPISLKFYRLFQGERTDRSMYYPFMDYYITELTARLLENGGRYQAQYLIQMNLPRLTPDTVDVIFDTYKTDLGCDIVMF